MTEEKILELASKYLSGNISDSEKRMLFEWLESDKKNEALLKKLKEIWDISGKYESDFEPDVNAAINRFKTRIDAKQRKKYLNFTFAWKAAAAILILFIFSFLIIHFINTENRNKDKENVKLISSLNSNAEYLLPDGSKVWLNKNSSLNYNQDFENRVVYLSGEAYFEVQKQNGEPFTIHAGNTKTVVLGTSFIIKTDSDNKNVEVIVLTGKVSLEMQEEKTNNNASKVLLNAGDKGLYTEKSKSVSIEKNTDMNFLAWKTKTLQFVNTNFKDVVACLSKYYDKEIVVTSESIKNCTLTSTYKNQDINEVLEELQILLNLEYQIKDNKVIISKGGC